MPPLPGLRAQVLWQAKRKGDGVELCRDRITTATMVSQLALPCQAWEPQTHWTGCTVPSSPNCCHEQSLNDWFFQPFAAMWIYTSPASTPIQLWGYGKTLGTVLFLLLFSFVLQNIACFPGCSGISISDEETSQFYICNEIPGLEFTIILSLRSWKNLTSTPC